MIGDRASEKAAFGQAEAKQAIAGRSREKPAKELAKTAEKPASPRQGSGNAAEAHSLILALREKSVERNRDASRGL
jgi:hypothetical protein